MSPPAPSRLASGEALMQAIMDSNERTEGTQVPSLREQAFNEQREPFGSLRYLLPARVQRTSATLPLSIFTTYTAAVLWPLSLPEGPTLLKAILPLSPVNWVFHNAVRIASGSALPAFAIAATMVWIPS